MGNNFSDAQSSQPNPSDSSPSIKCSFILELLESIIFKLNEDNINSSVVKTMDLACNYFPTFPYYFMCRFIYSAFVSQMKDCNIYLRFINEVEIKEKEINPNCNGLLNEFTRFLLSLNSHESYFLIEMMIQMNMISIDFDKNQTKSNLDKFLFFAHRISKLYDFPVYKALISKSYEELSKNDWELHKKLIEEGHNPNEIAKIIRKDEIEKLLEISSQTNFDFNQRIFSSYYERCSPINDDNVKLIDYAAFFGSVKCFKFLLMNGANVENTGKYAVVGGNLEIIHLCEQNHSTFENAFETAVKFHKNEYLKYLLENKINGIALSSEKLKNLFLFNELMNIKLFNILIEQGRIDINTKDIYLF